MLVEIEKENRLFSKKAYLDTLVFPSKIIGRQDKAKELVRMFLGYKQGFVVPFISVYGRSGSGKSTVVRFVCENMEEIAYCFVNLRKAKTVFGCANLILSELGQPNLKSAQGINIAIEQIGNSIELILEQTKKDLFVLALDEFDVMFYDKRGKPSDFVYKLVTLIEKLREKGSQLCIVGISNNVMTDYEIDDRVRSRIGSSEIFFGAYSQKDVFAILKERAKQAFSKKIDNDALEYCAKQSSEEHGDARRAIDLLRIGAELASLKSEKLGKNHIDLASEQLQKDRVIKIIYSASYHLRLVCAALARITYLTGEPWHSTSTLYEQYNKILVSKIKPLSYRRISELLVELQNTGIATSQTGSKGRHGYGTQYKLLISPEMIGKACFDEWWKSVVKQKIEHEAAERRREIWEPLGKRGHSGFGALSKQLNNISNENWKKYVGLD